MDRLHFSRKARRRAQHDRLRRWAAFVSIVAIVIGIPGADAGIRALQRLTGNDAPDMRSGDGFEGTESAASSLQFRHQVFAARPTPTPTEYGAEGGTPSYSGSIIEIIHAAAAEFGLSGDYLASVASCESTLNPGAVNGAGYHGLFQFDLQTWGAYGYGSIYDPVAQARTAARLIAAGQASRWPHCA